MADPHRWLEDGESPDVVAWTEEQGRAARRYLDAVRQREHIHRRLTALLAIGVLSPPVARRGRYFYQKRTGQEPQPILYWREGLRAPDRILLDPAQLSADQTSALDWFYPDEEGRRVAYGISEGGSERSVLAIRDVETGHDLPDRIPWTRACSIAWRPDGDGFFYTRYPEPGAVPEGEEDYHRHVYEHVLGRDWRRDPRIFGEDRPKEDWPNVQLSPDGRWLLVSVSRGWTRTDVYLADRGAGGGFVTVVEGVEALFGADLRNDRLHLHTNLDAPRYRLVRADLDRPGPESWRDVIPQGEAVLEGAALVGDAIVAQWLHEASSRLTLHDGDGTRKRDLELPMIGTVEGLSGEWDGHEAFFGFSSYTHPPAVMRVALPEGATEAWERVEATVDPTAFAVRLVRFPSRDGTSVSMFLVHARDRPDDGTGPAVLNGYGGFDVSLTPAFGRTVLLFLERGGLFAVAHLRGGGEYGEDWHRAGMLDKKQNVFDDAIAAAEHLVRHGHAARDRLAVLGGSNGGLLVGALVTQRPDLFRAAVCQVPLLDMLRYHRFGIARLWIPEYGSAEDPAAFEWLRAYSPYHRVTDGVSYPAILLTTGESDSRVDPLHARKMAARLQEATGSGRPVLLRLETRAGHGQGKPLSKLIEEWTDVWSFLFAELGIETPVD